MTLGKKAPLKERYGRYNQTKFMNKNLLKAIMNRSRLLNRYRKTEKKTEATRSTKKSQMEFYNNVNVKYITENNFF